MTTNTSISVTLTPELRLEQALKQAGIEKPATVTRLIVSGTLTNDDFKYIRKKMNRTLTELDMSEASIEDNKIGYKTFTARLTSVSMPDSITAIDDREFARLEELINITVHPNNPSYSSEEGVLFDKDKTALLHYPRRRQEEHYTIPDSVMKIKKNAFQHSRLTSITIPNSVAEIDTESFTYCINLTSVIIPDSVAEIGNRVFFGCRRLTSITIPDSVAKIGRSAFWGCKMLNSITIPSSITEIGGCTFSDCYRLTSLFIPSSVTKISNYAFDRCFNLTINVDSDNPVYSSENGILFNKERTELIRYPAKHYGDYVIPSTVKKIGDSAFEECSRLTSITIPDSVTEIDIGDYGFFDDCPAFITVHPDNPVYKSANGEIIKKK